MKCFVVLIYIYIEREREEPKLNGFTHSKLRGDAAYYYNPGFYNSCIILYSCYLANKGFIKLLKHLIN